MHDRVKELDPAQRAAPVIVDRNPAADQPGHGRVLPLIGGVRPHTYDVVFDGGRRRVYADTPGDVLGAVIPGYDAVTQALSAAEDAAERLVWGPDGKRLPDPAPEAVDAARDAVQAAFVAAFEARCDHATAVRQALQSAENEQAVASGVWDDLDDEARGQCEASARGEVPVGVVYLVPDDDGGTTERGMWPFEAPRLVISKGDYGLFDPAGTEEPESLVGDDIDGREVISVVRFPRNMVILDPTEEEFYVESLEVAGVLDVTVRPVDLPDEQYASALALGRKMREAGEDGGVPFD